MGALLVVVLLSLFQAMSDYLYEDKYSEVWYLYLTSLVIGGAIILWLKY
ncbi:hypothetical protein [Acinetobacter phage vB_AbaM_CP14]|nr:hypothetical protein [Acinetobacter phage vB_AbaM_CP14]